MRLPLSCLCALAVLASSVLSGCGYVHFGRYEPTAAGNPELVVQNTDLRIENKILRQEIALAHKEKQVLRDALENRSEAGGDQSQLATQLNETVQELGTLRANYSRLQSELSRQRSAPAGSTDNLAAAAQIAELKTRLDLTEGKLAQSAHDNTQLQEENDRLRQEADRMHQENAVLAQQVQTLTQQNEQTVTALSQLNTELLAQREAHRQAEDSARAARSQLQLVMAQQQTDPAPASLAEARQSSATGARKLDATLRLNILEANSSRPTAELRTSPERLQAAAAAAAAVDPDRYHFVAEGDTLESLARKYYGKPERWRVIYAANNDLLRGGRPLKPGMKLVIPE